jgi:hypothetical protein
MRDISVTIVELVAFLYANEQLTEDQMTAVENAIEQAESELRYRPGMKMAEDCAPEAGSD